MYVPNFKRVQCILSLIRNQTGHSKEYSKLWNWLLTVFMHLAMLIKERKRFWLLSWSYSLHNYALFFCVSDDANVIKDKAMFVLEQLLAYSNMAFKNYTLYWCKDWRQILLNFQISQHFNLIDEFEIFRKITIAVINFRKILITKKMGLV